jgi:hypothetical protein
MRKRTGRGPSLRRLGKYLAGAESPLASVTRSAPPGPASPLPVIGIPNPAHPKIYLDALHPKAGASETTRERL